MKTNKNQKSTNHQPAASKPFFSTAPEHAFFSAQRATSPPFFQPQAISPLAIQAKYATSETEGRTQPLVQRMPAFESEITANGELQRKEINSPSLAGTIQMNRGKRKGKGKFSTVAASPAAQSVTNMFIQQHMGNKAAAHQMAQNRADSGITASHTIDLTETARLLSEMQQRIATGYYIPENQVMSPYAGGMQYLTGNSYKIWETSIDSRGRVKKTKEINKQFYYDVLGIAGNALHHFDGPA